MDSQTIIQIKMRILTCLSGLYRTFEECYPTLIENFINVNNDHHFDIIGFFSEKKDENLNLSEYNFLKHKIEKDPFLPDLTYQLEKYIYETHVCVNNFYQLYGLKQVNLLRNELSQEYDLLVRVRTDFKFLSPLIINDIDLDKIYIPYGHDHRGGINDRFALGSPKLMDKYFNRYDFWMEKHDEIPNYITHAEANLKLYLESLSIPVERIPFDYCLRRPGYDLDPIIL
jgi:hypothetical protein